MVVSNCYNIIKLYIPTYIINIMAFSKRFLQLSGKLMNNYNLLSGLWPNFWSFPLQEKCVLKIAPLGIYKCVFSFEIEIFPFEW